MRRGPLALTENGASHQQQIRRKRVGGVKTYGSIDSVALLQGVRGRAPFYRCAASPIVRNRRLVEVGVA